MSEEEKCRIGHQWNGVKPEIKESLMQDQYPDLHNKPCDCGRVLFTEEACGCPHNRYWEIVLIENPNFV